MVLYHIITVHYMILYHIFYSVLLCSFMSYYTMTHYVAFSGLINYVTVQRVIIVYYSILVFMKHLIVPQSFLRKVLVMIAAVRTVSHLVILRVTTGRHAR